jgi:hypothetical protein
MDDIEIPAQPGGKVKGQFVIDMSVGTHTRVVVTYNRTNTGLEVQFTTPAGTSFIVTAVPIDSNGLIIYEERAVPGLIVSKELGVVVLRLQQVQQAMVSYIVHLY